MLQSAIDDTGDGYAIVGNTAHEVTGSIEGVDYPEMIGVGITRAPAFFGQECVIRVGFAQVVEYFLLCCDIHFGDKVSGALGFVTHSVEFVRGPHNQVAGFASGTQGDGNHRFHDDVSRAGSDRCR